MTDDTQITPVTLGEDAPPQSPMEALRAKREEIAGRTTVLIPLPEYEEMGLHVKYRLVGRDEIEPMAKRVRQRTKDKTEQLYQVLVGTMLIACEGFYMKPADLPDDKAEVLTTEVSDEPVETYQHLATELGGEFTSPVHAVAFVFGDNEFAVGSHAMLLNRWLGNTGINVDAEIAEG